MIELKSPVASAPQPRRKKLLDFWSGGYVILLAILLPLGIVGWHVGTVLLSGNARYLVGDGENVDSYGFDLSNLRADRELFVASGMSKDGLPLLKTPEYVGVADVAEWPRKHRAKLLVTHDRVLGVTINGESRAYPLEKLAWHQVVNDVLGGKPILVTYDPLCDSAAVFDRTFGGSIREFGFSGILLNSNLVMYDRHTNPADESLWCQLQMRAIAGPAAATGERLGLLPSKVLHWEDWRAAHPQTSILKPVVELAGVYKRTYNAYWGSDLLRFPVSPLPPASKDMNIKTPMLIIQDGDSYRALAYPEIARNGTNGAWTTLVGNRELTLRYANNPPVVWIDGMEGLPPSLTAFRFAWHALGQAP